MVFFVVSATGLPGLVRTEFELCAWSDPGLCGALEPVLLETDLQSSIPHSSLASISHPNVPLLQVFLPASASSTWFQGCYLFEMATRKRCDVHDVEQAEKMIPLITGETAFSSTSLRVGFWNRRI